MKEDVLDVGFLDESLPAGQTEPADTAVVEHSKTTNPKKEDELDVGVLGEPGATADFDLSTPLDDEDAMIGDPYLCMSMDMTYDLPMYDDEYEYEYGGYSGCKKNGYGGSKSSKGYHKGYRGCKKSKSSKKYGG